MRVVGIDVGSTVAKIAVVNEKYNVEMVCSRRICGDPVDCVEKLYDDYPELEKVNGVCVTGSSRNIVAQHLKADLSKPEILAHAYATTKMNPNVRTIIEIGGQDSKIIMLKDGILSGFKMNSVCAAGTGTFLESQAHRFGLSMEEFDDLAKKACTKLDIKSKCAIFIESAAINLQRNGTSKEEIITAIFRALANNYISQLCNNADIETPIYFQGGVAKLYGMRRAFQEKIGKEVLVPEKCEYLGAIGAGYLLIDDYMNKKTCRDQHIIQCKHCANRCLVNAVLDGNKYIYTGGVCGNPQIEIAIEE